MIDCLVSGTFTTSPEKFNGVMPAAGMLGQSWGLSSNPRLTRKTR
ncbi:MAG TPA: hypothetical protein VL486_10375 [Verrucomicrobiae bacterium]|nr:hypothetical protein [Verrucomicrobiae bacterium]